MNFDETKQAINEQTPDFLEKARKLGYICPLCGSGSGKNGTGISRDKKRGNKYHCFACNFDGDVIALWQATHEGMNFIEAVKTAAEHYGLNYDGTPPARRTDEPRKKSALNQERTEEINEKPLADQTEFYKLCNDALMNSPDAEEARTYLHDRGITDESIKRFNIGYCSAWRPASNPKAPQSDRIIIPRSKHAYLARRFDGNEDASPKMIGGTQKNLFNEQAFNGNEPCFVVEGELDAISVIQRGGNAVAMGSTSNTHAVVQAAKAADLKHPLLIALDNDEAGQKATPELIQELSKAGINAYAVNIAEDAKDPNEALMTAPDEFTAQISHAIEQADNLPAYIETAPETAETSPQEQAERVEVSLEKQKELYIATSAANDLPAFGESISERASIKPIATGYPILDKVLDGGLYEGLYCIGAISSLGKTTFIMQLADQTANGGNDVLIFSLEMSKYELMAKSLSRLTYIDSGATSPEPYKQEKALTTRGILDGSRYSRYSAERMQAIDDAKQTYTTYAKHIYIREGIGDIGVMQIREAVERHIQLTGNRPLVIVDYLQILAPYDKHATDKQNTDKAVLELKRISRDCKLPVIAISSFNRDSYGKGSTGEVKMNNFKESGAIEYSADVLIGLQFTAAGTLTLEGKSAYCEEAERAQNPRAITLKVMKNRNGTSGAMIDYMYYPAFNYFKEIREREQKKKEF